MEAGAIVYTTSGEEENKRNVCIALCRGGGGGGVEGGGQKNRLCGRFWDNLLKQEQNVTGCWRCLCNSPSGSWEMNRTGMLWGYCNVKRVTFEGSKKRIGIKSRHLKLVVNSDGGSKLVKALGRGLRLTERWSSPVGLSCKETGCVAQKLQWRKNWKVLWLSFKVFCCDWRTWVECDQEPGTYSGRNKGVIQCFMCELSILWIFVEYYIRKLFKNRSYLGKEIIQGNGQFYEHWTVYFWSCV